MMRKIPTELTTFEEVWEHMENERAKHPWRQRYRRAIYRLTRDLPWWFLHRFHPAYRYHVMRTGFPPGWRDRDTLMEQLIIKLLIDFVEQEKPYDHFDTKASNNAAEWVRLREIHDFFKTHNHLSMKHADLTPWLVEIVQLRGMMWT